MLRPDDVAEYKQHLENFLKFMCNNQDINANYANIPKTSSNVLSKLKAFRDETSWSMSITPAWDIGIENDLNFGRRKGQLLIGGRIEVKDSKLAFYSFSVSIVENSRIIRRFHFDVDTGAKAEEERPKCHMQYAGDAQNEIEHAAVTYDLDHWLIKPRLPFPPIDIVLLLDLMLRQMGTAIGRKLVEEPFWKSLVRESERFTIRDYYSQIDRYFGSSSKSTLFETLCKS